MHGLTTVLGPAQSGPYDCVAELSPSCVFEYSVWPGFAGVVLCASLRQPMCTELALVSGRLRDARAPALLGCRISWRG